MGRKTHHLGRNYGWGKQLHYAGHNALNSACNGGRFATVAAHSARWKHFCRWARKQNVNDMRDVTVEVLRRYADYLLVQHYKPSYAQNLISSCNTVLEAARGDSSVWVSPLEALGDDMKRFRVRETAPEIRFSVVQKVINRLRCQGHPVEGAVVELCRTVGLRSREAVLIDSKNALKEHSKTGRINVFAGTKGGRGRSVDRWIPVSERALEALEYAAALQAKNRNLIPENRSCHEFLARTRELVTPVLKTHDIKSLHELRAAYACERYEQMTGCLAPCVLGGVTAEREVDLRAREVISQELGHGRIDIVAAYVGGRS